MQQSQFAFEQSKHVIVRLGLGGLGGVLDLGLADVELGGGVEGHATVAPSSLTTPLITHNATLQGNQVDGPNRLH